MRIYKKFEPAGKIVILWIYIGFYNIFHLFLGKNLYVVKTYHFS